MSSGAVIIASWLVSRISTRQLGSEKLPHAHPSQALCALPSCVAHHQFDARDGPPGEIARVRCNVELRNGPEHLGIVFPRVGQARARQPQTLDDENAQTGGKSHRDRRSTSHSGGQHRPKLQGS